MRLLKYWGLFLLTAIVTLYVGLRLDYKYNTLDYFRDDVRAHLKKGGDINQADIHGSTPLLHSIGIGDFRHAEELLHQGADPNRSRGELSFYHFYRIGDGPEDDSALILLAGLFWGEYYIPEQQFTPQKIQEYLSLFALLLQKGADPDFRSSQGNTALSILKSDDGGEVRPGLQKVIQLLLQYSGSRMQKSSK